LIPWKSVIVYVLVKLLVVYKNEGILSKFTGFEISTKGLNEKLLG
jgi:hypothetical protein